MKKIIFLTLCFLIFSVFKIHAQINSPSELTAVYKEYYNWVKLTWQDNSNNELGFLIERSEDPNQKTSWEIIGEAAENYNRFYDYWIVPGSKYYYRVFAYGMGGMMSNFSNIDSVFINASSTGIPNAPTNLRIIDIQQTSIKIEWDDNSNNELGFKIARKAEGELYFKIIDTVAADILTYQEVELRPNTFYEYKVCAYNEHGISAYTNIVSGRTLEQTSSINFNSEIPGEFFLSNNYPNPFNPATKIIFGIPEASRVNLSVYDLKGQTVASVLKNENLNVGIYVVMFNADKLSSGIYFYKLESISFTGKIFRSTKKMLLIK
jgi:hypothetical protein